MTNPWLRVPLADYEAHMALPHVGQDRLLADVFASALHRHEPESVAVIGCAGGNGFDRISPHVTRRIVGIDLNPDYVRQARERFADRLPGLELIVGDVQADEFDFEPVELVYAGLLFEYVDVPAVLDRTRNMLCPGGVLLTVLQLPGTDVPEVTPSPYASLTRLESIMNLVPPDLLQRDASALGFNRIDAHTVESVGGKRFSVQSFRLADSRQEPVVGQDLRSGR